MMSPEQMHINYLIARYALDMIPPCAWFVAMPGLFVMWRMTVGYVRQYVAWRENASPCQPLPWILR